jgi:hypothetical protein
MASTYPAPPPMHHKFVTVKHPDVSGATSVWVVPGFRGRIRKIHSVIDGTIFATAGTDTTLTPSLGGTNVTNGVITITASGSAAGDVDSATPSGSNTFTPTDAIRIASNGGGDAAAAAVITLELEPV